MYRSLPRKGETRGLEDKTVGLTSLRKPLTPVQQEARRQYSADRRAWLREAQRCQQCGWELGLGFLCSTYQLANNRAKLRCRYRLSEVELAALEFVSGGQCTWCGKVAPLEVEHDHRTGVVRGLACASCNMYLRYRDAKEVSLGVGR